MPNDAPLANTDSIPLSISAVVQCQPRSTPTASSAVYHAWLRVDAHTGTPTGTVEMRVGGDHPDYATALAAVIAFAAQRLRA